MMPMFGIFQMPPREHAVNTQAAKGEDGRGQDEPRPPAPVLLALRPVQPLPPPHTWVPGTPEPHTWWAWPEPGSSCNGLKGRELEQAPQDPNFWSEADAPFPTAAAAAAPGPRMERGCLPVTATVGRWGTTTSVAYSLLTGVASARVHAPKLAAVALGAWQSPQGRGSAMGQIRARLWGISSSNSAGPNVSDTGPGGRVVPTQRLVRGTPGLG